MRGFVLYTEHYKMDQTKMNPGQNFDEFLFMMDSYRDRINASCPRGALIKRQFEYVLLQALSSEYDYIYLGESVSKGKTSALPSLGE